MTWKELITNPLSKLKISVREIITYYFKIAYNKKKKKNCKVEIPQIPIKFVSKDRKSDNIYKINKVTKI